MASDLIDSQLQAAQVRIAELEQGNQQLRAELAQLRAENNSLQKSEARYRQVFENAPMSMVIVNRDGYTTQMNAAAEDLFGLSLEQLNQQACPVFDNPQLVENGTLPYMQRALAGETVIEPPSYYDASQNFEGGKFHHARGHYLPIRDAAGAVEGFVEIAPDYEDFFVLQAQLLEEKDRAAQERARLLSTVAQVANLLLRTPDYTTVLPEVVRLLGEAVGSDRCGVMQDIGLHPTLNQPAITNLTEWCKSGVPYSLEATPSLDQAFLWSDVPEAYETLIQGQVFNRLVADIKEPGRSLLQAQGNTCCLFVPILVEDKLWGLFGFDNCGKPQLYDKAEIAILQVAAESIAAAIERQTKDKKLLEAQQALIQAEQARSLELERLNAELQQTLIHLEGRDRILEATTNAVNALLTADNLDIAVNTALQIIGESLNTDRVAVIENYNRPSDSSFPYWRGLHEWSSPYAVPQLTHPKAAQGSYAEIEWLYELFQQGQTVSYQIEEASEPFRSEQIAIGVKSTNLVPIYVEGNWWGMLGIDDCREATHRTPAELSVLKTAVACIGSAIQRDRAQKAVLQAEQARSQELKRLNTELQQTLKHLSESEERYRTLFEISSEGIFRFEFEMPIPVDLPFDEQVDLMYRHCQITEANSTYAAMYSFDRPEDAIGLRLTDVHVAESPQNYAMMRSVVENSYQVRNAETEETDRHGKPRYFLNNTK